jgi:N-alpha-acetyl-L-2,4-diaminobutyrate deacetylase
MREIVQPEHLDLERPGRRDYLLALEHDSIWGDHLIPLTVFVGDQAEPGRGLVAFGATHGNEYEGPVALRHLLRDIDLARVRGRIVLVPVLNPAAFGAGARDSVADDGVNLNRAFVLGAGHAPLGGVTHRIAAFVRQHLWPHVHVVLDLHAGGQVARFLPCTSFHVVPDPVQHALTEATARDFGTPLVITYQNETPGLLTSEAERLGKITLGCELGWGGAVQQAGVRFARRGVLAACVRHGQYAAPEPPEPPDPGQRRAEMVDRACFVPAPFAGHYEPLLECGAEVHAGETVGLLHDFQRLDTEPHAIRAGVGGIVIAQAWQAPVRQGQHVLVVGQIVPFAGAVEW